MIPPPTRLSKTGKGDPVEEEDGALFQCAATHNSVSVNPNKHYRPVGCSGGGQHAWCEAVSLHPHRARPDAQRGLPNEPVWVNGVLEMPEDIQPCLHSTSTSLTCQHGTSWPPLLVQHCRAIQRVMRDPKLLKLHKESILQLQQEIYNAAGQHHCALHEPAAALEYQKHQVFASRQTGDLRAQGRAYGGLSKAHNSRASKSKPTSWQEKRDEQWARHYLARHQTMASEETVRRRMVAIKDKEKQRMEKWGNQFNNTKS
eukprot:CAMPEP_0196591268 /NCGR_PEP_ID=MMETSP1081-20130531/69016_1 /TAXON_ID=36882 /ORGANISM="Pyramimonas amylifera, Strain CCMP720" /LENGTH=257 /DNA_ID=CAMNT_0041914579 /DNA_START=457 /DNA_END=1230 /DNA_ORIENTATION=-